MQARAARSRFSIWIWFNGASRGTITNGRCSLSETSAARSIRFDDVPAAIPASVFIVQGMTTMPSQCCDPDASREPRSFSLCIRSRPGRSVLP